MTDNGSAFRSRRYAKALRRLGVKHRRTRPYTPKTHGKAERFVQASLRDLTKHRSSEETNLSAFLFRSNWQTPRTSLNAKPPISRIGLSQDSLLRLHN
jgi:transposase InsO family protein